MAFQPPKRIPELAKEPEREILRSFVAIARDLVLALAEDFKPTDLKTADYTAKLGDLVLVTPPATGMRVLIPLASLATRGARIQIAVLSVASGGTVTVVVVGGSHKINAAASLVLSSAGLTEFTISGATDWSATGSGGGGGVADGVYGSITVSGGGTIWRITDGTYGDITVSGGGLTWSLPALVSSNHILTANFTLAADEGAIIPRYHQINAGVVLTLSAGSTFSIN